MILAIETATLDAGVALYDPAAAAARAVRRARVTTHSESLMEMVRAVLDEAGRAPADLAAVAVSSGPGSFTGLRMGLATAKGLCLALDRPLLLVPSLQALALRAPPSAICFACLDAWKGEVYAARFAPRAEGEAPLLTSGAEEVLPPEEVVRRIRAISETSRIHLIGDAAARWPALQIPEADTSDRAGPDPVDVARLAALRLARGEEDPLESSAPRYVRASEAELAADRRDRERGAR